MANSPTNFERGRRLGDEVERWAPWLGPGEVAEARGNFGVPRQNQKQQNYQEEQWSETGIWYIQGLMLRNLTGDAHAVLRLGNMMVK